jgi:hypothetical protein
MERLMRELVAMKPIFDEFPGYNIDGVNYCKVNLLSNKRQWEVTLTGPSDYGLTTKNNTAIYAKAFEKYLIILSLQAIDKSVFKYMKES